ncbi:MAG: Rab family GTPase [Gemmatimonadaceae bacterium]
MSVVQRKVCMLGATSVGKTSLVRRFVESIFSEKYQATIGVKIDRKLVELDGTQVSLLLWDLQGEDEFQRVRLSYLRGASGLIYVADGTRPETLATTRAIRASAEETVGAVPSLILLNKTDLAESWGVDDSVIEANAPTGIPVVRTSAKTGANVEDAFSSLVQRMVQL